MSIQKRTRLQSHLSILAGGALAREKADVKGRLNFSIKTTTAAKVPLTESLLDNWLKNNHIAVDKIYYLSSLFVSFFTNFSFQIYFSTAEDGKTEFCGNAAGNSLKLDLIE